MLMSSAGFRPERDCSGDVQQHQRARNCLQIIQSGDPFGNRTRNFPACSIVPQLTDVAPQFDIDSGNESGDVCRQFSGPDRPWRRRLTAAFASEWPGRDGAGDGQKPRFEVSHSGLSAHTSAR
jgi:hypothetical protein